MNARICAVMFGFVILYGNGSCSESNSTPAHTNAANIAAQGVLLGNPPNNGSTATIDWSLVFQQQSKIYESSIQAQQAISVATLASVKDSSEQLIRLITIFATLVSIITAIFGWWFFRVLKHLENIPKEASKRMKEMDEKLQKSENRVHEFEKSISEGKDEWKQTETEIKRSLQDTLIFTDLARLRFEIMSGNPEDQFRATSALAQNPNPQAIPILKELLRNLSRAVEVLSESLYGLGRWGKKISTDKDVVNLVMNASKHEAKQVRLVSADAMWRIAPENSTFRTRLIEMRDNDLDNDVSRAAERALTNSSAASNAEAEIESGKGPPISVSGQA